MTNLFQEKNVAEFAAERNHPLSVDQYLVRGFRRSLHDSSAIFDNHGKGRDDSVFAVRSDTQIVQMSSQTQSQADEDPRVDIRRMTTLRFQVKCVG